MQQCRAYGRARMLPAASSVKGRPLVKIGRLGGVGCGEGSPPQSPPVAVAPSSAMSGRNALPWPRVCLSHGPAGGGWQVYLSREAADVLPLLVAPSV